MIAKAELTREQFNITSERMWMFCLSMYTPGSETFDNATQSAEKAGYKGNNNTLRQTAHKLVTNGNVVKAKTAIMAGTDADSEYTINQYQADLDQDRTLARTLRQPAAAISATVAKGRSMGYDKDNNVGIPKDKPVLTAAETIIAQAMAVELTRRRLVESEVIENE